MKSIGKREAALKLLGETGILESNYAPPGVKLMWRFGIDCPPPHMAGFVGTALVAGLYFALAWGVFVALYLGMQGRLSVPVVLLGASGAGLCFGVAMAAYYAFGRRKHGLPLWNEFRPGAWT